MAQGKFQFCGVLLSDRQDRVLAVRASGWYSDDPAFMGFGDAPVDARRVPEVDCIGWRPVYRGEATGANLVHHLSPEAFWV